MRLRYGQELSELRPIPLWSTYTEYDYSPGFIEEAKNQSPIKTMSEKLDKFRVKYITETAPMPFNAYQLAIYAEDEKAGSELGRFARRHWLGLYPPI